MFGIGLPEMILILALALIVVGPDKLPDLARSVAKMILELKKTAEGLKDQIKEEKLLEDIRPDLEEAAKTFKNHMLEHGNKEKGSLFPADSSTSSAEDAAAKALEELTKAGIDPSKVPMDNDSPAKPPADVAENQKKRNDATLNGQPEELPDTSSSAPAENRNDQ